MTPTMLLWSVLVAAVVGGGMFFALLTWRFKQKHHRENVPTPTGQQRASSNS